MWLTNGGSSNLVAVLVKTDEGADSVYKNMTTFLVEKESGFGETAQGVTIPGKIDKMGYKGVDTTEMVFEGHKISADQILGGAPGKGFYQMMDGVEVGRVNVAARGCGVANRAFELGIAYSQQRETFGRKIAEGNSRVLSARLNDARFFWDLDRRQSLESFLPKLDIRLQVVDFATSIQMSQNGDFEAYLLSWSGRVVGAASAVARQRSDQRSS